MAQVGDSIYIRDDAWPACEWPCTSGEIVGVVDDENFAVMMDDYESTAVHISEIEVVR